MPRLLPVVWDLEFGICDFPRPTRAVFRSERALCLSKYVSVFVWTYVGLCRALRRHLRRHLYRDLHRNPYRLPSATLNRASLQKPLREPNPALFLWLYGLK